ncbi:ABC transporter ATP-binding protein [Mangrovibacterium lignilyticum]|uniref:ABC transporter ATP-binding protein n=1 Tax=Mangrovibacterium lignilyticum TaxID=2668052 RepID=UPI0013D141DD|nr:ABC transporter ATP-binding protein [Mangrovibacterium lignilyticum]
MLEINQLCKSFTSGSGEKRIILDELDLTVNAAERVAIVGPSGSGKSTLLNLIGALDAPDSGTILLNGESVFSKTEAELAVFRNHSVGFVFQSHHLLPQFSLKENILLPVLAQQRNIDQLVLERADYLMERLGIASLQKQRPSQLSRGECQRTAVARALINRPKILLADEPTGALDQHSADQLVELLLQLNREEKVSLLVVTHAMRVASQMGKIYNLTDGKLLIK